MGKIAWRRPQNRAFAPPLPSSRCLARCRFQALNIMFALDRFAPPTELKDNHFFRLYQPAGWPAAVAVSRAGICRPALSHLAEDVAVGKAQVQASVAAGAAAEDAAEDGADDAQEEPARPRPSPGPGGAAARQSATQDAVWLPVTRGLAEYCGESLGDSAVRCACRSLP